MSRNRKDSADKNMHVTLTRSCHGCIKSKRKCDRRLPQCSLCEERRKECVYKNEPVTSAKLKIIRSPARRIEKCTATSNNTESTLSRSHNLASPDPDDISMAFAASSLDNARLDPPDVIMRWDDETFDYILEHLKSMPKTFVHTRGTLFIHPQLYPGGFPPLLRDVYTLCAMHLHQTDADESSAHTYIDEIARRLIDASDTAHSFTSLLALIQAFLLFEIVTLFFPMADNIRQQSENLLCLLQNRTYALFKSVPATLPSSLSPYQAWILAESVRRTFHFVLKIRGVYTMQTQGHFRLTLFCESLPVNIASLLWDLDVSSMPALASLQSRNTTVPEWLTRQDLISYRELTDRWDRGEIGEVGRFEELQLIACKGLEVQRRLQDVL